MRLLQKLLLVIILSLPLVGMGQTFHKLVNAASNYSLIYDIKTTNDGGFIAVGYNGIWDNPECDGIVLKLNKDGDIEWSKIIGGNDAEGFWHVIQTSDNGYMVTGMTKSGAVGGHDMLAIKLDSNGDIEWNKIYGGPNDDSFEAIAEVNGGYVIFGMTNSYGEGAWEGILVKLNNTGDTVWAKTYGGTDDEFGIAMFQSYDGNFILSGSTRSFGSGDFDGFLIKVNDVGDTLWTKTIGEGGIDQIWSALETQDKGIAVAGLTTSYSAQNHDIPIIKMDSIGNIQWAMMYGGVAADGVFRLKETSDGSLVGAGRGGGYTGTLDMLLMKVNSNGDTLWTKSYGDEWQEQAYGAAISLYDEIIMAGKNDFNFTQDSTWAYILKTNAVGYANGCMEYGTDISVTDITPTVSSASFVIGTPTLTIGTPNISVKSSTVIDSTFCYAVTVKENMQPKLAVSLYPNPTTGTFTVRSPQQGMLTITDLRGRQVATGRLNEEFSLQGQPNGIYFVQAGSQTLKLVLAR